MLRDDLRNSIVDDINVARAALLTAVADALGLSENHAKSRAVVASIEDMIDACARLQIADASSEA